MQAGVLSLTGIWGQPLLAVCLGILCAILAGRGKIDRGEEMTFRRLREEKAWGSMVLEVGRLTATALLIFLLFWKIHGGYAGASMTALEVCASVFFSVCFGQVEIGTRGRKIISVFAYAVLVAYGYSILIIHGFTKWTDMGDAVVAPVAYSILELVRYALIVLAILETVADPRRGIMTVVALALIFPAEDAWFRPLLTEVVLIVMTANLLGKPRTTAKVLLVMLAAYVVLLQIGWNIGWTVNFQMTFEYGLPSWTWGMGHTNLVALVLMSMLMLAWYLWTQKRPWITLLIFEAAAVGIWYFTYCRTAVIVLAMFGAANLVRTGVLKLKWTRLFYALPLLPVLIAAASVAAMIYLPQWRGTIGDGNFTARFSIPWEMMQQFPLEWYRTTGMVQSRPVDNLFLHILMYYGIIPMVLVTLILTWVMWRYVRNRQYSEAFLLCIWLVYSIMENAMIHMPFGFALMLGLPDGMHARESRVLGKSADRLKKAREMTTAGEARLKPENLVATGILLCALWEIVRMFDPEHILSAGHAVTLLGIVLAVMALVMTRAWQIKWVWVFYSVSVIVFLTAAFQPDADALEQNSAAVLRSVLPWVAMPAVGVLLSERTLKRKLKRFCILWSILFAVIGALGIWCAVTGNRLDNEEWGWSIRYMNRTLRILDNSTYTAIHLGMSVVIALTGAVMCERKWARAGMVLLTLPMIYALCITDCGWAYFATGAGVGVLFSALMMQWMVRKRVPKWGRALAALAMVVVIAFAVTAGLAMLSDSQGFMNTVDTTMLISDETDVRVDTWNSAISLVRDEPAIRWRGTSVSEAMNVLSVYDEMMEGLPDFSGMIFQALVETGVWGVIVIALLLILIFRAVWRLTLGDPVQLWQRAVIAPAIMLMVACVMESAVSVAAVRPPVVILTLFAGAAIAMSERRGRRKIRETAPIVAPVTRGGMPDENLNENAD